MKCRSCGSASFGEVIDLGLMPLVNNLLDSPDACARFPLHVVFCRNCSLAQLTEAPRPQEMFDEYLYFSSQSQTMLRHAESLVDKFVRPGHRVLEIASNDGYLLAQAKERGANILGVDPAANIAAYANGRGVPTRCEYFNRATAEVIENEWGKADTIFANNVLAHVPDPNEIVAGIACVLDRSGIAHIEVPSLVRMIDNCAFDTIYHEHQCYFSMSALKELFNRHALSIISVDEVDVHGGSFHLQIRHEGNQQQAEQWVSREQRLGIRADEYFADFAQRVRKLGQNLIETMSGFGWIAGYGAAAKGVVLLNYFALGVDCIPWVADVSPHKQGRYLPGTNQPVVNPQQLLNEFPPATLLLPWNIRKEVMRRNQRYLDQGGRFIVPIPEVGVFPSIGHAVMPQCDASARI